ncbi:MAG: hypothetical protein WBD41_02290, partial [Rhodococcus sp. (in: high G+C Gram-positive bacteria)]
LTAPLMRHAKSTSIEETPGQFGRRSDYDYSQDLPSETLKHRGRTYDNGGDHRSGRRRRTI